jgi:hypothetical protein
MLSRTQMRKLLNLDVVPAFRNDRAANAAPFSGNSCRSSEAAVYDDMPGSIGIRPICTAGAGARDDVLGLGPRRAGG